MIDLHCHILPGLDDGALDLQDSLGMALQAQQDGISIVCATPHIRHDHDVKIHQIAGRVRSLQAQIDERGLQVTIVPGGEVAETEADRLSDEELQLAALGGAGGWVLLEPAPGPMSASLQQTAVRLAEPRHQDGAGPPGASRGRGLHGPPRLPGRHRLPDPVDIGVHRAGRAR